MFRLYVFAIYTNTQSKHYQSITFLELQVSPLVSLTCEIRLYSTLMYYETNLNGLIDPEIFNVDQNHYNNN